MKKKKAKNWARRVGLCGKKWVQILMRAGSLDKVFFLGLIWCLVRVCWCCWFCTLHHVVLMNLKFSEVYTLLRNSLLQRKREIYSCTSNSWDKNNECLWVQWYKYFHEVKDEMFHSMMRSQVEWYISSFCKIALCGMWWFTQITSLFWIEEPLLKIQECKNVIFTQHLFQT